MSEKIYCRMRHKETKDEVQVVADYVDGVFTIRHFYAPAKDGKFHEVTCQYSRDKEVFLAMWTDTIKAYEERNWEVIA